MKFHPKLTLTLCSVLFGVFLGGCASAPRIELDQAAASRLKRIALLGVPEPATIEAANLGGAASAFGLIGGLIQGSNNVERAKKFTAAVKQQNYAAAESLLQATEQELKARGFDVVVLKDQKPKLAADKKTDDFSHIKVDADAILVVWYGVDGYISQPYSTDFEPWVLIKAHMVDVASQRDLYFKMFVVGWKMKVENSVYLAPDSKYRFSSFNDLMARVPLAASGLVSCNELVAQKIADDLKPH